MNINQITYNAVYLSYDQDLFLVFQNKIYKATPSNLSTCALGFPEDAYGSPVILNVLECVNLQHEMRSTLEKARKTFIERMSLVEANANNYINNAIKELVKQDEPTE